MKMRTIKRRTERMVASILIRVKSSSIFFFSVSALPSGPPVMPEPRGSATSFCLMASTSTTLVAGYLMKTSTTLLQGIVSQWAVTRVSSHLDMSDCSLPSLAVSILSMLRVPSARGSWPKKDWMSCMSATPSVMVESRSEISS